VTTDTGLERPPAPARRVAKTQKTVRAVTEKVTRTKKSTTVARDPSRRALTDPTAMRALAHPVRLALLEALSREGPLTATAAAGILDDSPGNMSWHLNVLAKYGFVEEAEGGHGRARPWRLVNLGTEFSEEPDNPELTMAAQTFSRVIIDRTNERAHRWLNERASYPLKWRKAGFTSNAITYLTADELEELGHEVSAIVSKYRERTYDKEKRPKGSRPVAISAMGHPITPSPTGN
jgi:predicted ArsR family transcriptional regulator